MKKTILLIAMFALVGCQSTVSDTEAAQAAYYASRPPAPAGYRHPAPGQSLPGIVLQGIPEGEPGWDILIKEGCYYYRFAGALYPAPDSPEMSWNDPAARPYCGS